MQFLRIFFFFSIAIGSCAVVADCPTKIKWKKLRTVPEVKEVIYKCIPKGSTDLQIQEFLTLQNLEFYHERNCYQFAALTKSGNLMIEKKWLVKIYVSGDSALDSIHVEAGYTGP